MDTYVINYRDQTAMTLVLTDEQYKIFCTGFQENLPGVLIPDVGCLRLDDVRSIIKQTEAPMQENESYSSEVTEEEKEYAEYLRKVDEWAAFDANSKTFDAWKEEQRKAYKDDADF